MEKKDKTLDPASNQRRQSGTDSDRLWAQLTWKYLNDLPQQLDAITTILEVKDYSAIKKQAHRIKGTSGTYRLETISHSAARLERLADGQNPDAIASAINRVKRLVELETRRLNSQTVSKADSDGG